MIYSSHFMKQFTLFDGFVLCFMVMSDYKKKDKNEFYFCQSCMPEAVLLCQPQFHSFSFVKQVYLKCRRKRTFSTVGAHQRVFSNPSLDKNSLSFVEIQKNKEAAVV